jgi:UPF0042 nucleotide-binding protein
LSLQENCTLNPIVIHCLIRRTLCLNRFKGEIKVENLHLTVITGLSGAGKTEAMKAFEDLGYYCIDNIPPVLIPQFIQLCSQVENKIERIAIGIDIRGGQFFDSLFTSLHYLEQNIIPYEIVFLEASDEVLVRRFKETRRRHPLGGEEGLLSGIGQERERLSELRGYANYIINTSYLTPAELKVQIQELFGKEKASFHVSLISFGYKNGIPIDSDMALDVRFLPNPHYVEKMRLSDGNNPEVYEYVFKWPVTQKYMEKVEQLLEFLLPLYIKEGRRELLIGIGCTGGRHRSVAVANHLADTISGWGYSVRVTHRDIEKNK